MRRVFETFLTSFRRRLPEWITNPKGDGSAVWFAISVLLDGYAQRAYEGIYAKYPTYAPADALSYIGADRRIIRGVGESRDGYVARLLGWLSQFSHLTRGSPFALLEQVRAYCGGDGIRVRLVDRRGNWYTIDRDGTMSYLLNQQNWLWDPIPPSPDWARQWLIIYPAYDEESATYKPWDKALPLDGSWSLDGSVSLGTDADPGDLTTLRQIVEDWTGGGKRLEWIIYYFHDDAGPDPDAFDPANPAPDGTWWAWGSGEPYEPNRDLDAVYMKGGKTVTPYGAMLPS
jgi:hypothetical protein